MDRAGEATIMSKPIDYDSPRRPALEDDGDRPEELTAHGAAARSPKVDLDEAEAAENYELPGADLSGEELTVAVVPMQLDEFRCTRCFLVHHRSRRATRPDGQELCLDCA
jgi:hypothetical protein